MRVLSNKQYKELAKKNDDIKQYWKNKLSAVQERHDAEVDAYAEEIEDLKADKDKQEIRDRRRIEKLTAERDALKEAVTDADTVEAQRLDLVSRENILKARMKSYELMEKEVANIAVSTKKAEDLGYKKGYADGVADGLREATKITADDRKMLAQIAALSAASHSTDASKEIGAAVAGTLKDLTHGLPDGKR